MRLILQRIVLPLGLALAGTVVLVAGANYRSAPVWRHEIEEREVEEEFTKTEKIAVPIGLGWQSSPFGDLPGPPGETPPAAEEKPARPDAGEPLDGTAEVAPPGMKFITETFKGTRTVTRPVRVAKVVDEPESWLIFEATIGGVQRREGAIWRTYGPDESPPALCPT